MNYYIDNGFKNRKHYLNSLAEDFELDRETVYMMADLLGESEDFDGLITSLEDYSESFY